MKVQLLRFLLVGLLGFAAQLLGQQTKQDEVYLALIEQRSLMNFNSYTAPAIAEYFTRMGGSGTNLRSSAFQGAMREAEEQRLRDAEMQKERYLEVQRALNAEAQRLHDIENQMLRNAIQNRVAPRPLSKKSNPPRPNNAKKIVTPKSKPVAKKKQASKVKLANKVVKKKPVSKQKPAPKKKNAPKRQTDKKKLTQQAAAKKRLEKKKNRRRK